MKTLHLLWLATACLAGAAQAAPVPPPYAWVVHPSDTNGASSIVKLDARTGTQIDTIPIPVANGSITSSAIDVVASPDGRWVAIAGKAISTVIGSSGHNADLVLIDTATDTLKVVVDNDFTNGLNSVAWATDGSVLYGFRAAGNPAKAVLVKIDPDAPVPDEAFFLFDALDAADIGLAPPDTFQIYPGADGRHAVLTSFNGVPAVMLDLVTHDVRAIGVPADAPIPDIIVDDHFANWFAAAPDGRFYYTYVARDGSAAFFTRFTPGIDAASDQFDKLPLPGTCGGRAVAVSPDGTRAYVTNGDCTANPGLLVFDLTNFTQLPSISLPGRTTAVDVGPTGETALALMPLSQTAAIDLATGTVQTHDLTDPLTNAPFTGEGVRSLLGRGIMIGGGPMASAIAVNPANPQFVYSGTDGRGIYVSSDGGQTWTAANTGLTSLDIVALAVTSDGAAVYAATRTGGVFKSTDNGQNWQAMNNGLPTQIRSLAISPNNNQVIYAGIANGEGVYKSTDGGAMWTAMNHGLPN